MAWEYNLVLRTHFAMVYLSILVTSCNSGGAHLILEKHVRFSLCKSLRFFFFFKSNGHILIDYI